MYISSADLMTRNTSRRVEVACPIDSPEVRARLHEILSAMQRDTVKARILHSDGTYGKKPQVENPICAQELLMRLAAERAETAAEQPAEPEPLLRRLWNRLAGRS